GRGGGRAGGPGRRDLPALVPGLPAHRLDRRAAGGDGRRLRRGSRGLPGRPRRSGLSRTAPGRAGPQSQAFAARPAAPSLMGRKASRPNAINSTMPRNQARVYEAIHTTSAKAPVPKKPRARPVVAYSPKFSVSRPGRDRRVSRFREADCTGPTNRQIARPAAQNTATEPKNSTTRP